MSTLPQGLVHLAPGFGLRWDETRQMPVLVHLEHTAQLTADQGEILKLCNGSLTAQGIIDAMKQRFPGINSADVQNFLETAYMNNIIHGEAE
jgi:coenzyme PQQ biosynthesis protein PqqD